MASVTHELRNPLNGILGMLDLLEDGLSGGEYKGFLRVAKNTSLLLLNLINDILDFSQMEADSLRIANQMFLLPGVIEECINIVMFQIQKKNLSLKLRLPRNFPKYIISDKNRYKQILLNLLSNAIKFTSDGMIRIDVTYEYEAALVRSTVSDTGIGISPKEQTHLFKLYGKLDSSKGMNLQGVGLGLTICKQLAEKMGGEITLKSEEGKGEEPGDK